MSVDFEKKYFIMLGKKYLIRNSADEKSVLNKQKRIEKKTGKKPRIVVSNRTYYNLD